MEFTQTDSNQNLRVKEILSVGEECIQPEELESLLNNVEKPVCYDGFEPSGRMHIAQGIYKTILVNRLTKNGCKFKFWIADWFAMLNKKMGGDLKKIKKVGQYMIQIWKACGMDLDNVEFIWASDEINARSEEYWSLVLDISTHFNLSRIKRCCTIMGRKESDELGASQIFYPCMQCADIFFLKANIAQLGMDQRKVNMLAREYSNLKKMKHKPIILSHHMLMGLKQGQEKMSKSDPDSAIFMEDSVSDVKRKIKKAYCPPQEIKDNPCIDYFKYIVFNKFDKVTIQRKEEYGGNKEYTDYQLFEKDYLNGELHPGDIKKALTLYINICLEPVRKHFESGDAKQLLNTVKKYRITR
jgi:tyrosyl-tRNA synthetase